MYLRDRFTKRDYRLQNFRKGRFEDGHVHGPNFGVHLNKSNSQGDKDRVGMDDYSEK